MIEETFIFIVREHYYQKEVCSFLCDRQARKFVEEVSRLRHQYNNNPPLDMGSWFRSLSDYEKNLLSILKIRPGGIIQFQYMTFSIIKTQLFNTVEQFK